jgi:hypothetical protein
MCKAGDKLDLSLENLTSHEARILLRDVEKNDPELWGKIKTMQSLPGSKSTTTKSKTWKPRKEKKQAKRGAQKLPDSSSDEFTNCETSEGEPDDNDVETPFDDKDYDGNLDDDSGVPLSIMLDYIASGCKNVPSGYMTTESRGLVTSNGSEMYGIEVEDTGERRRRRRREFRPEPLW